MYNVEMESKVLLTFHTKLQHLSTSNISYTENLICTKSSQVPRLVRQDLGSKITSQYSGDTSLRGSTD